MERGVSEILIHDEFVKLLESKKKLRIKAGFDPTAPDLHFGHTVLLNKLRHFQEFGHTILFLIGDFTGQIGDPSGKNVTRPQLSNVEIKKNIGTYEEQAFKILDKERTEIHFNSHWMNKLSAADLISVAAKYNVARMLERDDFKKRYDSGKSIAIHEFLYPLVQGYDSVALKSDVEIGGTDQKFNLLVGRTLQQSFGLKPQVVITLPILEGLDGVQKMSKSLNNYIALNDSPSNMFGKIMSISDELMWRYYELLSFVGRESLAKLKRSSINGQNPRDIKFALASELVSRFHSEKLAEKAKKEFIELHSKGNVPKELKEFSLKFSKVSLSLASVLKQSGLVSSTSEARRLVTQKALRIDGALVVDVTQAIEKGSFVVQAGKRRFLKIVVT